MLARSASAGASRSIKWEATLHPASPKFGDLGGLLGAASKGELSRAESESRKEYRPRHFRATIQPTKIGPPPTNNRLPSTKSARRSNPTLLFPEPVAMITKPRFSLRELDERKEY